MPLFPQVPSRGVLGTSPLSGSANFALKVFSEVHGSTLGRSNMVERSGPGQSCRIAGMKAWVLVLASFACLLLVSCQRNPERLVTVRECGRAWHVPASSSG